MSIINILVEFGVVMLCAFIMLIGAFVQGIVRVLTWIVHILEKAHKCVSTWRPKRGKREKVDVPL